MKKTEKKEVWECVFFLFFVLFSVSMLNQFAPASAHLSVPISLGILTAVSAYFSYRQSSEQTLPKIKKGIKAIYWL